MRKHRLEIFIVLLFVLLLTGLTWQALAALFPLLPLALAAVSVLGLIVMFLPWVHKIKGEEKLTEQYAPRFFGKSLALTLVNVAIVVLVVVILNKANFSKSIDLTSNKRNSLSEQSEKVLAELQNNVYIVCVPSSSPMENYCDDNIDLINLYQKKSAKITFDGPLNLADRDKLQRYAPSGYSRFILANSDFSNKTEVEGKLTESSLTNALLNLIKNKKVVYFLQGAGEPSLSFSEGESYADVVSGLKAKSYEAKEWNFTKQGSLPVDAKLIVAGSNKAAYPAALDEALLRFVAQGGKVILSINPYREQGLSKFYKALGIEPENVLLTLNPQTPIGKQIASQKNFRPPVIATNFNEGSPVTGTIAKEFSSSLLLPVDGARPLRILSPQITASSSQIQSTVLMTSFSAAPITIKPAERNRINLSAPFTLRPDKNFDANKNWNLAVALDIQKASALDASIKPPVDEKKDSSQVIVFGFELVNPYSKQVRISEELLPLTVAYLYQDEELVSVPPREFGPQQFHMERNPVSWLLFFAGVLPLGTAIIGVFVWMRRRSA